MSLALNFRKADCLPQIHLDCSLSLVAVLMKAFPGVDGLFPRRVADPSLVGNFDESGI